MKYVRMEQTNKGHGVNELPVFMLNNEELKILYVVLNLAYMMTPKISAYGELSAVKGRIRNMRIVIGEYLKSKEETQ